MTRIIAGEARGRRLVTPEGETTRPTSNRAKEAIFPSWSTHFGLEGTHVLDLFVGSGVLSLEAAPRGARPVVPVENDPNAIAVIRKNIHIVGRPDVVVSPMKVSSYFADAPGEPFDRVIADPPYELAREAVTEMLGALRSFPVPGTVMTMGRHRDDDKTR